MILQYPIILDGAFDLYTIKYNVTRKVNNRRLPNERVYYLYEVRKELGKYAGNAKDIITEKDIAPLPEPVQKYFRYCGFLGKEKMMNAQVIWEDVFLKTSPKNTLDEHRLFSV